MTRRRGSGFLMIFSFILILFLLFYFEWRFPNESQKVAVVDDKNITLSHLRQFMENVYGSFDFDRALEALNLIINQEVLVIHAHNSGIIRNELQPQFDKQIQYEHERLMLEMFFNIDAEHQVEVSRQEMKDYYDSQPLFNLRSITFEHTEPDAFEKATWASREMNRLASFDDVYSMLFPQRRFMKTGFAGIINFYSLPPYLEDHAMELTRQGLATQPVENDFGFTVYFRDGKPTFREARNFIKREITSMKTEEIQQARFLEIVRNNKVNLFSIDKMSNPNIRISNDEVLASNRLTNDVLTVAEMRSRLADLYHIHELTDISYQELVDYINLFLGQKVILSMAREKDYFNDKRFTSRWANILVEIEEIQIEHVVEYMMEYFYDNHVGTITDAEIMSFYQRNADLYRMPDFFRLQTIVLNDRITANRVFQEALINLDFDSLVLEHSNDPFARTTRGRGPFLSRIDLEESYDILYTSNIGDVIVPIEIDIGIYHVYKILDRVQGAVRPVEEVMSQVTTKLMFEKMENFIEDLIHLHNIQIRIYEEELRPRVPRNNRLPFFENSRIRELSRL